MHLKLLRLCLQVMKRILAFIVEIAIKLTIMSLISRYIIIILLLWKLLYSYKQNTGRNRKSFLDYDRYNYFLLAKYFKITRHQAIFIINLFILLFRYFLNHFFLALNKSLLFYNFL